MLTTILIVAALFAVAALFLSIGRSSDSAAVDASPARADSGSWLRPPA